MFVGGLAEHIPIWAINSGRLRSEEKEGGIDNFMVELFAGDSFDVMISVERGMHRSLKTASWGAYFAASYFGGIRQEDLQMARLRKSHLLRVISTVLLIIIRCLRRFVAGLFTGNIEMNLLGAAIPNGCGGFCLR